MRTTSAAATSESSSSAPIRSTSASPEHLRHLQVRPRPVDVDGVGVILRFLLGEPLGGIWRDDRVDGGSNGSRAIEPTTAAPSRRQVASSSQIVPPSRTACGSNLPERLAVIAVYHRSWLPISTATSPGKRSKSRRQARTFASPSPMSPRAPSGRAARRLFAPPARAVPLGGDAKVQVTGDDDASHPLPPLVLCGRWKATIGVLVHAGKPQRRLTSI